MNFVQQINRKTTCNDSCFEPGILAVFTTRPFLVLDCDGVQDLSDPLQDLFLDSSGSRWLCSVCSLKL